MDIERLTSDLAALERMSDIELLNYFESQGVLKITRPTPEQIATPSGPIESKTSKGAATKRFKQQSVIAQATELMKRLQATLPPKT